MKIKNLTRNPLSVNLLKGESITVEPQKASRDLTDAEVRSREVQKHLRRQRVKLIN